MALERIRGQYIAVRMLEHELVNERLPQTLLFHGPEGCGKFLTALELVKHINCDENPHSHVNCSCSSCTRMQNLASRNLLVISKTSLAQLFTHWRKSGNAAHRMDDFNFDMKRLLLSISSEQRLNREYETLLGYMRNTDSIEERIHSVLDVVQTVSAAMEGSVIGIDSIREVQHFLSLKSGEGEHRCVIIDGAEHMNVEASNSFLKIAEDTPAEAVIILIASEKERIKETIRSRCRAYRFLPLSEELYRDIIQDRFGYAEEVGPVTWPVFYSDLAAAHGDPAVLNSIVHDIVGQDTVVSFLDDTVAALGRNIPSLYDQGIHDIVNVESVIKQADQVKKSILQTHTDAQTALADFLLKHARKILRYVS